MYPVGGTRCDIAPAVAVSVKAALVIIHPSVNIGTAIKSATSAALAPNGENNRLGIHYPLQRKRKVSPPYAIRASFPPLEIDQEDRVAVQYMHVTSFLKTVDTFQLGSSMSMTARKMTSCDRKLEWKDFRVKKGRLELLCERDKYFCGFGDIAR